MFINTKGFIEFPGRNFSYRGDRGTWVRAEADGTYTLFIGAGTVSESYITDLDAFLAQFGKEYADFTAGVKHILTPVVEEAAEEAEAVEEAEAEETAEASEAEAMETVEEAATAAPAKAYHYAFNGVDFLRAEKVQITTDGGWSEDGLRYEAPWTYTGAGEYKPVPAEEVPADKREKAVAAYHANMAKAAELCAKYDRAQGLKTWEKTTEPVTYESGNEWYPYVYAKPRISGGEAAWVTYAGNNPEDIGEYMGYFYGPEAPSREQLLELLEEMLANTE